MTVQALRDYRFPDRKLYQSPDVVLSVRERDAAEAIARRLYTIGLYGSLGDSLEEDRNRLYEDVCILLEMLGGDFAAIARLAK